MVTAQPPQIEKTVYGEGAANDANVVFPFDLALPAARDIWKMAEAVRQSSTDIRDENDADTYWKGPHHDTTNTKVSTYEGSASSVAAALEGLANGIAAAWAAARGQQNRINKARYVQNEEENESAVNKFFDNFNEDDYGPPPDDPDTPGPPGFAEPGGARMYGEFGP
jgi:hypothetical protein